jgi:hypothetical protein
MFQVTERYKYTSSFFSGSNDRESTVKENRFLVSKLPAEVIVGNDQVEWPD